MSGVLWAEERKAELRELWQRREDGNALSAAEIGRRMGLTRGQVLGQARRLGLVRDGAEPRAQKQRLVLLVSNPDGAPESWFEKHFKPEEPKMTKADPQPVEFGVLRVRHGEPCCFPLGTPGKRDFRFCDAPTVPGKPYCAAHVAVAYVPVLTRQMEAACG